MALAVSEKIGQGRSSEISNLAAVARPGSTSRGSSDKTKSEGGRVADAARHLNDALAHECLDLLKLVKCKQLHARARASLQAPGSAFVEACRRQQDSSSTVNGMGVCTRPRCNEAGRRRGAAQRHAKASHSRRACLGLNCSNSLPCPCASLPCCTSRSPVKRKPQTTCKSPCDLGRRHGGIRYAVYVHQPALHPPCVVQICRHCTHLV